MAAAMKERTAQSQNDNGLKVKDALPAQAQNGKGSEVKDALATQPEREFAISRHGFEPRNIQEAWWYANRLANSELVPERWRGHFDDCFIAIDMALRLRVHPIAFLQSSYVVYGKPGLEAKLVMTMLNQSGLFTDPLDYEIVGADPFKDDYAVRAYATRKSTGKVLYGPWITWKIVRGEGWDTKVDKQGNPCSKWLTIPELMFVYRAASWFVNMHCPEIKQGILTTDELEDIGERKIVTSQEVRLGAEAVLEQLNGKLRQVAEPATSPQASEPVAQEPTPGAYTCRSCGQTFDEPAVHHKGANKGKPHCPDLDCRSTDIIRTELLGVPEPDPSITTAEVEPDQPPREPVEPEPAKRPKPNGGALFTPTNMRK